jgi:hypothetical protein
LANVGARAPSASWRFVPAAATPSFFTDVGRFYRTVGLFARAGPLSVPFSLARDAVLPIWSRHLTSLACTAAALFAGIARADRGEVYANLEIVPTLASIADPATSERVALPLSVGVQLSAFYGVTHQVHVGLALHAGGALDVRFSDVALPLPDGSRPRGELYENVLIGGVGVLGHFRLDTGELWAPFGRIELGASYREFREVVHFPAGTTLRLDQPSRAELVPSARAGIGLEYRFGNRLVGSIGISTRVSIGSLLTWQLELPVAIAYVWW